MSRYLAACNFDTRKAMTLYRKNVKLSQALFTILNCFEIALRNKIDHFYLQHLGNEWLKNSATSGGIFNNRQCTNTKVTITNSMQKLGSSYTHNKLVAELGFGFWRYMFARHQYRAGRQQLIQIFTNRPSSSPNTHYNNMFIFRELRKVNDIRNRIAHHEPICFFPGSSQIDLQNAQLTSQAMLDLPKWMDQDLNTWGQCIDQVTPELKKLQSEFVFKHVS